jgi:hypothetical protein
MDQPKNELIESEATRTRQGRGDGHMSHVDSVSATPPLQNDPEHHQGHADRRYSDDDGVKERVLAGGCVHPPSDCFVHM